MPLYLKEKINSNKHLFCNLKYEHGAPLIKRGPLVSVIVTYYDNHDLIDYSIHSLLNQTYKNIQIIVVFDGCKPNNIKHIKQKFKKNECIEFITLQKNIGNALAKNKAIPYAKGKFVTAHDSDDIAHPQKVETYINAISNNKNLVGIVSYWFRIDFKFKIKNLKNKFFNVRLNPNSLFFNKSILKKNKWTDLKKGNDSFFFKQIKFNQENFLSLDKTLTLASLRNNSISFTNNG